MDKREKMFQNVVKFLLISLFVAFLIIYLSGSGTYYESQLHKKTIFTQEQIKKFEQDVADGKNVTIEDYVDNKRENYANRASNAGLFLSKNISGYFKKGIEKGFKMIAKFIE